MLQVIYRFAMITLFLFCPIILFHATVHADEDMYKKRLELYKKTEAVTLIPWYYLAAIDQYERNIKNLSTEEEGLVSISLLQDEWFGIGNFSKTKDVRAIRLFNGIGMDGNGDGNADPENGEDMLLTIATYLSQYGVSDEDIKIGLWNLYKRDLSVKTITNTAKVFKHFQTTILTDRDFPVSIDHNYSYRTTWGDGRGFGGRRIHEGTDIFANYGTPVKSTTYGVVELKGWNLYGGWRIGIRDIYNIYHYYAHLNRYNDEIKVGDIVKPGDVLGSVGSSGYGPPGTAGKFPPHLHYGMYKDNGRNEWSFDPYPYLVRWERVAKEKRRTQ